jgi:hypothetical protein
MAAWTLIDVEACDRFGSKTAVQAKRAGHRCIGQRPGITGADLLDPVRPRRLLNPTGQVPWRSCWPSVGLHHDVPRPLQILDQPLGDHGHP